MTFTDQIFPSLNLLVYTEGITVETKGIKKSQTIWLCVSSYKQYYRQHWTDDTICPWISQRKTFIGIYWRHYGRYYSGIKKKIIWWCDIYTDRITNVVTIKIILLVNPSRIFNLWPNARPSSPSPPFLLLCKTFLCNKITTPQSQSQHNSTSHNFSSNNNTQFVSIHVLI